MPDSASLYQFAFAFAKRLGKTAAKVIIFCASQFKTCPIWQSWQRYNDSFCNGLEGFALGCLHPLWRDAAARVAVAHQTKQWRSTFTVKCRQRAICQKTQRKPCQCIYVLDSSTKTSVIEHPNQLVAVVAISVARYTRPNYLLCYTIFLDAESYFFPIHDIRVILVLLTNGAG